MIAAAVIAYLAAQPLPVPSAKARQEELAKELTAAVELFLANEAWLASS